MPNPARRPSDSGFTLLETVVSIAVVTVVMSATTALFATSGQVARRQQETEAAARIADDGISRVRSVKGSGLVTGRDQAGVQAQWAAAGPQIAAYLSDSVIAWDTAAAAGAGASAALPTAARTVNVDGLTYYQSWYVGRCWLPAAGSSCGTAQATGDIPMNRVVVAVTWQDNACGTGCAYVTSTLVSSETDDPVFNVN